jgi:hypothetical protein
MAGACERIAAINADADVKKTAIKAVQDNNPLALFNKIVDKVGGSNESTQMTVNVANTNMKMINDSIISNNCKNSTSVDQTNSIIQSPDCLTSIGTICRNPITGNIDIACVKEMSSAVKIKGINQSNSAKANSQCEINAAIQAMSKQESTIDNVAKLKAMQDAQGMGASNKGTQAGCNEVNTNISDEKYLKSMSECINEVKTKQLNLLNTCGASDVDQANDVDLMNKCLVGAGIISETSQAASVKNKSDIASEQTAVGITPFASMASSASCCCCCIIIIIVVVVFGAMGAGGGNPADAFNKFKSFKK